jgi:hypothetical protein
MKYSRHPEQSGDILSSTSSSRLLAVGGSIRFSGILAVWILRFAQDDGGKRQSHHDGLVSLNNPGFGVKMTTVLKYDASPLGTRP